MDIKKITASIVVYHNDWQDIYKVLKCALNSSMYRLYIIDHGQDKQLKKNLERFSNVEYIPHENFGYGSGHNVAIRYAIELGASYHVVLNPDIYWDGNVIDKLAEYMENNPDVGQVMPKVFYPNGELQLLCKMCPSPIDLIFKRFLPRKLIERRLRKFRLEFTGYNKEINAPYLSGCFMFFRISALKDVGLFDERFFMYPEDIDITRRVHAKYKTMFYPNVSIVHAHAAASRTNKRMLKIHMVNMIKYFNKWGWIFDSERKAFNKRLLKELNYNSK